jgi:SAM-dependent methyltransferase
MKAARLYEESFGELFAVLAREAGKTLPDAVAELREAVDFLYYYAEELQHASGTPRGRFVCISPWNFPLAIFTGQIAAALAPGGRFVMYDGFRRADFAAAPQDVQTAARLFEVTTAVTNGFHTIEAWDAALRRAGLVVLRSQDLTDASIAGLRYLHNRSARFFRSWKYRLLRHVMPKYLIRNAVAGLVGPYMIEGAGPRSGDTMGAITYSVLVVEKPR